MMTSERYVEYDGKFCPVCESCELEAGQPEVAEQDLAFPMWCNDCNSTWLDMYALTGYQDLVTP